MFSLISMGESRALGLIPAALLVDKYKSNCSIILETAVLFLLQDLYFFIILAGERIDLWDDKEEDEMPNRFVFKFK